MTIPYHQSSRIPSCCSLSDLQTHLHFVFQAAYLNLQLSVCNPEARTHPPQTLTCKHISHTTHKCSHHLAQKVVMKPHLTLFQTVMCTAEGRISISEKQGEGKYCTTAIVGHVWFCDIGQDTAFFQVCFLTLKKNQATISSQSNFYFQNSIIQWLIVFYGSFI